MTMMLLTPAVLASCQALWPSSTSLMMARKSRTSPSQTKTRSMPVEAVQGLEEAQLPRVAGQQDHGQGRIDGLHRLPELAARPFRRPAAWR